MRIGILTQPLYCNYGGIVQCYALQQTLKSLGYETVVLQREFDRKYTFLGACVYYAKHLVKMLLGRKESWHYYVSQERRDYIAQNTYRFIDQYIEPRSARCYSAEDLRRETERLKLDAIIVGSDQVWRPDYSPCLTNYFLDFLQEGSPVKRISYAASFGGDEWTFSEELTDQCATLLKKFSAVSVRERSAVGMCREHFGVDASTVLDPTMQLSSDEYRSILKNRRKRGSLFCYFLDRSAQKHNIVNIIARSTGKKPFESMPDIDDSIYNLYGEIDKAVYPPVEDWLSGFDEADMVLTDSFHGTVFSIIFNKPFWVIGNPGRGMARFHSILSMFGLESRLLTVGNAASANFDEPIDWKKVNTKKEQMKEKSLEFIKNALA